MPAHRKQFGKRGLAHETAPGWGHQQAAANVGAASQAYASPGYGAVPENEDSVSITKMIGFVLGMVFGFQGRIGRMEYWAIGIIRFIIFMAAIFAFASTLQPVNGELESADIMMALVGTPAGLGYSALFLALIVCLFSLEVRRLHDRDASGFWVLLLFIPIVGSLYGLWLFIANGFFPGTPGSNRFDTAHSQAKVFD